MLFDGEVVCKILVGATVSRRYALTVARGSQYASPRPAAGPFSAP